MDGTRLLQYKYDWSEQTSFHNYIERLDLACADSETIGMIGSAFFLGWTLFAIAIPRLADLYGRKPVWLAAVAV